MAGGDAAGAPQSAGAEAPAGSFWSFMLPVLGAIGTGIGVIGFVIFFGGFVVWSRFHAAGLPAEEAVAQVARNDLIVTGAAFLVPALLAALAAVAVALIGWDWLIGGPRRDRRRTAAATHDAAARHVEALGAKVDRLQRQRAKHEREIDARDRTIERLGPEVLAAEGDKGVQLLEERNEAKGERSGLEEDYKQVEHSLKQLQDETIPAAQEEEADAARALASAGDLTREEQWKAVGVGGLPLLVAQFIVIAAALRGLSAVWAVGLFAVAFVTLGVAVVVVSSTERFGWYALTVFVGVGLVIAASTYTRTQDNTKVSPVAAIVDREPVVGYFVAETGDAVYVAHPSVTAGDAPTRDDGGITLQRLSKDSVSDLTVGALAIAPVALRRSVALALALCRHAPSVAGGRSAAASAAKHACTDAAIRELTAIDKQLNA
jgi:hypothetical protein